MQCNNEDFLEDDYLYFDWNAIQNLKKNIYLCKDVNAVAMEKWKIFKALKTTYKIPLSTAHLCDLSRSTDETRIAEDLYFLANEFSDGTFLMYIEPLDCYKLIEQQTIKKSDKNFDIFSFFYRVREDGKQQRSENMPFPAVNIQFAPQNIDIDQVDNNSVLKSHIEQQGNMFNPAAFQNLLLDAWQHMDKSEFVNQFNNNVRNFKVPDNAFYITLPKAQRDEFELLIKGLIEFNTLSAKNIKEGLPFIRNYFRFLAKDYDVAGISEKRFIVYNLLNFTNPRGAYGENFNKKNQPSNFNTDMEHFLSASNSRYLITDDANLTKKCEAMNILELSKIDVIKIDAFFEEIAE